MKSIELPTAGVTIPRTPQRTFEPSHDMYIMQQYDSKTELEKARLSLVGAHIHYSECLGVERIVHASWQASPCLVIPRRNLDDLIIMNMLHDDVALLGPLDPRRRRHIKNWNTKEDTTVDQGWLRAVDTEKAWQQDRYLIRMGGSIPSLYFIIEDYLAPGRLSS